LGTHLLPSHRSKNVHALLRELLASNLQYLGRRAHAVGGHATTPSCIITDRMGATQHMARLVVVGGVERERWPVALAGRPRPAPAGAGRPHRRPRPSSTTHPFWRLAIACGHQQLMQHANLPSNSKYNVCMQLMCVLCVAAPRFTGEREREDQKCPVEMTEHGSSLVVRTLRPAGRPAGGP